ncbi:MAG: hypothetical protein N5P05_001342 [Chroococcopsis gigantea SAG 12.99]|jgi:hypothetical protein|nr:DUF3598 family protein [Chlorogloea purpurea SAG 13.99]MDV2999736.1 hypothetical protein [Chroococcopsis gigantea SAG 12.99]
MLSQWECLLKNCGHWHGSFTRFSPGGELLEDTPTLVSLDPINNNKTIYQLVRRFYPDKPPSDLVLQYSNLNKSVLFCENGAFSQGSIQWAPYSEFGSELGLIENDRRLRLVQMFDKDSNLEYMTLIREKLPDSTTPERPGLTIEQLLGRWRGEATTYYTDGRNPTTYETDLKIDRTGGDYLSQELRFGDRCITSQAKIETNRLLFLDNPMTVQILLLPDGASCNTPLHIPPRQPFVLELGWLLSPRLRQRLIRGYDATGKWMGLTFVTESKEVS